LIREKKRRMPYGTIHRLAHETIDNLDLKTTAVQKIHRAIHYAFSNSYSPDVCYAQYAKNHTGCLERSAIFIAIIYQCSNKKLIVTTFL
jgi:hypothetical protein